MNIVLNGRHVRYGLIFCVINKSFAWFQRSDGSTLVVTGLI